MNNTDLYQEFQKMSIPAIPTIDAERTAKRLRYLRRNNINLKKYVCRYSRLYKEVVRRHNNDPCPNCYNCENCDKFYDYISPSSLARCFDMETRFITDVESGKNVTIQKVLLYSYISQVPLSEILIFTLDKNSPNPNPVFIIDNEGKVIKRADKDFDKD